MTGVLRAAGEQGRVGRACLMAAAVLVGLGGGAVAGSIPEASASAAAARVTLPNPVPTWTQYFSDDGPAGSRVTVPVRVWLAGRAPAAETSFATAASTPGNRGYGKYLTRPSSRPASGPRRPRSRR